MFKRCSVYVFVVIFILMSNQIFAQFVIPLPQSLERSEHKVSVYGLGSLGSLEDLGDSPSANIRLNIIPSDNASLFLSFNKGAGLAEVDADSFQISSILFPEIGNSALLSSFAYGVPWFKLSQENEIAVFIDFSFTDITLSKQEKRYNFKLAGFQPGVRYKWYYFKNDTRFSFFTAISYIYFNISDNNLNDFRLAFNNPKLPESFDGFGLQGGVQLNDLTVSVEYKNISKHNDKNIMGLSGSNVLLNFSISGEMFSF